MSVNFMKNLSFQKSEYTDIYRNYEVQEERKEHKKIVSKRNHEFLYILVGQSVDILKLVQDMFFFEVTCDKEFDVCVIKFGLKNDCNDNLDRVLQLEINHPYLSQSNSLVISSRMKENYLKRSYGFFTYKCDRGKIRKLDLFTLEKFYIEYERDDIQDMFVLKELVRDFRAKYSFKVLDNEKITRPDFTNVIRIPEKHFFSLEMINFLNDNWDERDTILLQGCVDKMLDVFADYSKETLRIFLNEDSFYRNFVLVEIYFSFMEKMWKRINGYIEKNITTSIKGMKRNIKERSVLHNALSSDKGIMGLDAYFDEMTNKLSEELEAIK